MFAVADESGKLFIAAWIDLKSPLPDASTVTRLAGLFGCAFVDVNAPRHRNNMIK